MSLNFWIISTIALIIGYLLYGVVTGVIEAYIDVKNRPRIGMAWCHKHGYFKQEHTLELFPELTGTGTQNRICPTCYYQAVWGDKKK